MSDDDESIETEEEEGEIEVESEDSLGKYIGGRNVNGERHGNGWAILSNGDQYDGDYRRGQRHGTGLYVFKNGARYLGRYRCGRKSGIGVFYYPDGSTYEGSWRKNVKHGYGVYTYANGDIYKGNWFKNNRHGVGIYIYKEDTVCFKGTWKNGVRVGPAIIQFKKHCYHGYWDYWYPQGPGMFVFDCKYILSGYYKSDVRIDITNGKETALEDEEEEKPTKLEEGIEEWAEEDGDDVWALKKRIPPSIWYAQKMFTYDYSKLPQGPIPLPIPDSEESFCDLSEEETKELPPLPGETEEETQPEEQSKAFNLQEENALDKPEQNIWDDCNQ